MAIAQRIESLKQRHAEVEELLHEEETRPAKDEATISKLKKEKLTLKDEITRLESKAA
ncbi:MAG: DUF465 domain-containing protein [Bdellovibrionales bacterium]